MKKKMLKKSDVLREGYVKGLKKAQKLIKESLDSNPFEDTEEWELLDDDDREMLEAYLEFFEADETLEETLENAQEKYVGTYNDWEDFGYEEFTNGGIDMQWLVDMNCIDWEQVGNILSDSFYMGDNGKTFATF